MASVSLPLTGMTCAACARTIERTLQRAPGVSGASVNFATGRAEVQYDEHAASVPALVDAVRSVGYDVASLESPGRAEAKGEGGAARRTSEEDVAAAQERAREQELVVLRRKLTVAMALFVPIF